MARHVDIFISTKQSLDELIKELELVFKIRLKPLSEKSFFSYGFSLKENNACEVGEKSFHCPSALKSWFVNGGEDSDLDFEIYEYILRVNPGLVHPKEKYEQQDKAARSIFEKLKATGKYRLMLIDDVQVKMDEFSPDTKSNQ